MINKRLTVFEETQIRERILAGENINKLCKFYSIPRKTLYANYIRDLYVKRIPNFDHHGPYMVSIMDNIKRNKYAKWQEMRNRGHTTYSIAKYFCVAQPTVAMKTFKPENGIEDRINITEIKKLLAYDKCEDGVHYLTKSGIPYAKVTIEVLK